jgi:hypothetical protein
LSALTTSKVGSAWQAKFTMKVSGGTAPYKLSSIGGLPSGMKATLSGSTITISGKPAMLGSFNCAVNLTDSKGIKPSNPSFVLTINAAAIGQSNGVLTGNATLTNLPKTKGLAAAISTAAAGTTSVTNAEMRTIIAVETQANPKNFGVNGSVAGPFQVSVAAAKQVGYTLTLSQLAVWSTNVSVAAKYLQYCATQLANMGFPVTALNLYLVYQQGPAGAKTLLTAVQNGTAGSTPATANEISNLPANLKGFIPTSKLTVQNYYDYWSAYFQTINGIVNP